MKKPVLAIGLLLFSLFIMQVSREKKWGLFHNNKLIPTSCKAVLIPLLKKTPANWNVFCEEVNLAVEVVEVSLPATSPQLKNLMYRQLANHMSFVAKKSPPDILEKVYLVRFRLSHPKMVINAVTEGKYLSKLATIDDPTHIMDHLKSTVQVKEELK